MSAQEDEPGRSRPIFAVVPIARILAGERHAPVVYFAQMGLIRGSEVVKIGTSVNLQARMRNLYVPLANVLAVVPGGREVETGYHRLFAEYQVSHKMQEMFRLEGRLKCFLRTQTEGLSDGLPSAPMLVQPATREERAAEVAPPALVPDLAAPTSLLEIVRRFILPLGLPVEQGKYAQRLRQDRYRSDKGQLPDGLKFPEPAAVEGCRKTEKFAPLEVIGFNEARRGSSAETRR